MCSVDTLPPPTEALASKGDCRLSPGDTGPGVLRFSTGGASEIFTAGIAMVFFSGRDESTDRQEVVDASGAPFFPPSSEVPSSPDKKLCLNPECGLSRLPSSASSVISPNL